MQVNKFVRGLSPSIRDEVERAHVRNPEMTVEDLFQEAKLEETFAKRKPKPYTKPQLRGVNTTTKCFFCKGPHNARDCPKIAAKKAVGSWEERAPKQASNKEIAPL